MATLVSQDTSGTFAAQAHEVEVPERRTRSFKVFRLPDAPDGRKRFRVGGQVGPVHYRVDPFDESEVHKEIDLDILPVAAQTWNWACETNGYQTRFWEQRMVGGKAIYYIAQFRRAGGTLTLAPLQLVYQNTAGEVQVISKTVGGITPTIDNDAHTITWANAFGAGLDFRYSLAPDQFVKQVVIQTKASLPTPTINLPGLRVVVVMTLAWTGATPSNAFAATHIPADIDGIDTITTAPDVQLTNPPVFSHVRPDGNPSLWCHPPRAWDSYIGTIGDSGPHSVPVRCRLQLRGGAVLGLFDVLAGALNAAQTIYPVYIDTAIGEEQVGASTDDGMEEGTTYPGLGTIYGNLASTILYWGYSPHMNIACRFTTVPIPAGATITTSSLSIKAYSSQSGTKPQTLIDFENVKNPAALDLTTHSPGDLVLSGSPATWNPPTPWTQATWYQTSDISVPLQAIISFVPGGWALNDSLMAQLRHNNNTSDGYLSCYSWDLAGNVSGMKCNCTYTEGAAYGDMAAFEAGAGIEGLGPVQRLVNLGGSEVGVGIEGLGPVQRLAELRGSEAGAGIEGLGPVQRLADLRGSEVGAGIEGLGPVQRVVNLAAVEVGLGVDAGAVQRLVNLVGAEVGADVTVGTLQRLADLVASEMGLGVEVGRVRKVTPGGGASVVLFVQRNRKGFVSPAGGSRC